MQDIEIARNAKIKPIDEIASELDIPKDYIEFYGRNKLKINNKYYKNIANKKDGNLILVTAINPTPLGEGKTTISIGLADGLRKINKKSILALREPSLGPVFGIKGGATGGGYAQVMPMEEINLHFTGDIHAITSANNLISAVIDNHIYFGNKLKFKKVTWKRCLDLNDRALRKIEVNLNGEKRMIPREDGFDISVASEIMAIFCLASDLEDLKRRLSNIIVGFNENDEPIRVKDLKIEGSLLVLLKNAFNPNLVQTLENTPAIIHGGPFANIAHGCNSIVGTKMALKLADYVVTEAGFGADLGAEKFLDIKCRVANIKPSVVVCVATIKALKYHGGAENDNLDKVNIDALKNGINNLKVHIDNLKNKFNVNVVVAINKYIQDTDEEIKVLENEMNKLGVEVSLVEAWSKGGDGAIDLANKVVKLSKNESNLNYIYNLNDSIKDKILKVAKNIYRATDVIFEGDSLEKINKFEKLGYGKFPICIAKTQYSLSDNPKMLEIDDKYSIHVKDVLLKAGAEFIVILTGNIYTMPGLPERPSAERIGIDSDGNIYGIF